MIKKGTIKSILAERPYQASDGKQFRVFSLAVEIPYFKMDGTPMNDAMILEKFVEDTPEAYDRFVAHIGVERELTIGFSIRKYENPTKGTQYFQNATIYAIKTTE